jgi:hypothetical protein
MRVALVRPRQNHHHSLSLGAVIGISLGAAALVAIAATVAFMFYQRFRRTKARKRQSALDETIAMSAIPPPALDTQFAGRYYGARSAPPRPTTSPPRAQVHGPPRAPGQTSPRDPEEARLWADWLIQTAPKQPKPNLETNISHRPQLSINSPWLEAEPTVSASALPEGRGGSRITNFGSDDMRSPIELELAQDSQLEQAQGHTRATSGPLPGPSAIPASPPPGGRSSLQPPARMISIKRKPIQKQDAISRQDSISAQSPTTISPPSASPQSSNSNPASSRPPSLPYPDFNVPTSPDELFIPQSTTTLRPILELGSPISEEDVPVLLARERVEMLRQERERLERIQELKRLEEQARQDLREAQRSSLEAKRRSAEAQRKNASGSGRM